MGGTLDLIWPNDWDNPFDFQRALDTWVDNYKIDFPHQTLNYTTPAQFYDKSISKLVLYYLKKCFLNGGITQYYRE